MHSDKLNMAYHRPPKQPNDTKSLTHLPCNNHYPLSKGENGKRTIKFMVLALQKLILKITSLPKKFQHGLSSCQNKMADHICQLVSYFPAS